MKSIHMIICNSSVKVKSVDFPLVLAQIIVIYSITKWFTGRPFIHACVIGIIDPYKLVK